MDTHENRQQRIGAKHALPASLALALSAPAHARDAAPCTSTAATAVCNSSAHLGLLVSMR